MGPDDEVDDAPPTSKRYCHRSAESLSNPATYLTSCFSYNVAAIL